VADALTGDRLMARVVGMNIYTDVCFCGLGLHVLMGHLGNIRFPRLIRLTEGENQNNPT
jgi:hypothetical protein